MLGLSPALGKEWWKPKRSNPTPQLAMHETTLRNYATERLRRCTSGTDYGHRPQGSEERGYPPQGRRQLGRRLRRPECTGSTDSKNRPPSRKANYINKSGKGIIVVSVSSDPLSGYSAQDPRKVGLSAKRRIPGIFSPANS